jgi:F-type H+-transporting ATPase subunit delta
MKLSKENRRLTRELFSMSVVNDRIDPVRVRAIADRIVEEKPRQYVQVLREYTRLVRLEMSKREAVVTSAIFHEQDALAKIADGVRGRFGSDVSVKFVIDPEVIGGLRIKMGDDVWDGTIQNRLKQLKEQL